MQIVASKTADRAQIEYPEVPKIEPGDVVRDVLDPTRRGEHTPFRRGRVGPELLEGPEILNLEGDVTTARETGIFLNVRLVEPSEIRPP